MTNSSSPKPAPSVQQGRFAVNLSANLGQLGLSIAVGAWYVPFLVRNLGPAAYGLIPLASTMTSYMSLVTLGLNSAVGRSMTIALEQEDHQRANLIFNTSFWGNLGLSALLMLPAGLAILCFDWIIHIPPGYAAQARWLFAGTTAAFLLNQIKTPFDVSSFCRNRFDLRNVVSAVETLTRVGLVALLFLAVTPGVQYVGLAIFSGTIISSGGALWLWRVLTPTLQISWRQFDWGVVRSLTSTGIWMVVNQLGIILYLGIDLLVANILFGAEQGGRYAAVLQLPILIRTLGSTIGAVFAPTVIAYYARLDIEGLVAYVRRAMKCVGLLLVLPVGLMSGFAEPLLRLWLGPGFSSLSHLLMLLAAPLSIIMAINPLQGLKLATNRVKVPGIVTLGLGVANVGLALLLAGPMHCGLYGIAAAGIIILFVRDVLFTPVYLAWVLEQPIHIFWKELAPMVAATLGVIILGQGIAWLWPITSWAQLALVSLGVSFCYGLTAYCWILTAQERSMVARFIPPQLRSGLHPAVSQPE